MPVSERALDRPSEGELREVAEFLRHCRGTEPAEYFEKYARTIECAAAWLRSLAPGEARTEPEWWLVEGRNREWKEGDWADAPWGEWMMQGQGPFLTLAEAENIVRIRDGIGETRIVPLYRAPSQQDGWRPVAEYPEDGSIVRIVSRHKYGDVVGEAFKTAKGVWRWREATDSHARGPVDGVVTHFYPLPAAPREQIEQGGDE